MKVIGLDIGTTGCKAVVCSPEGKIEGYGFEEYDIIFGNSRHAVQNPGIVWDSAKKGDGKKR